MEIGYKVLFLIAITVLVGCAVGPLRDRNLIADTDSARCVADSFVRSVLGPGTHWLEPPAVEPSNRGWAITYRPRKNALGSILRMEIDRTDGSLLSWKLD